MRSCGVTSVISAPPLVSSEGEEERARERAVRRGEEGSLSGPREASVLVRLSAESLSEQQFILHGETPSLSVILPKSNFACRSHFISVAAA